MLSSSSAQRPCYARSRASPFKRLRIQLGRDAGAVERTRRMIIAVPSTFRVVTELAVYLHERFASTFSLRSPLRLSVDGYVLPAAQPLHDLIRESDVLTVLESIGGREHEDIFSTPLAKRGLEVGADVELDSIQQQVSEVKVDVGTDRNVLISSFEAVNNARSQLAIRNIVTSDKGVQDSIEVEDKAARLKAAKAAALAEANAALALFTSSKIDPPAASHMDHSPAEEMELQTSEPARSQECVFPQSTQQGEELRIFVGGLPWACTADVLRKDFSECGEIVDLKIMEDKETGRSRGFAFITFAEKAGMEAALKYDGDDYGGRTLKVNRTDGKGKSKGKGKRKK